MLWIGAIQAISGETARYTSQLQKKYLKKNYKEIKSFSESLTQNNNWYESARVPFSTELQEDTKVTFIIIIINLFFIIIRDSCDWAPNTHAHAGPIVKTLMYLNCKATPTCFSFFAGLVLFSHSNYVRDKFTPSSESSLQLCIAG